MGDAARSENGMRATVRPLVDGDRDAVVRVFLAAWRGYEGVLPDGLVYSFDERSAGDLVREALDRPGGAFVALDSGGTVGYARWEPGYLGSLYVDPAAQGRGAGAALLAETERAIREAGSSRATLWVFRANVSAARFYRAHGWVPDGAERREDAFLGEPEDRMAKELS